MRQQDASYQRSGVAQAHAYLWYLDKHRLPGRAPAPSWTALASFGASVPDVDMRIGPTGASWDPRTELLSDARRRLVADVGIDPDVVERELIRIVDQGGYRLPDTRSGGGAIDNLDRAARWTFRRLRTLDSYRAIAEGWEADHPGNILSRPRDPEARRWDAEHPDETGPAFDPTMATDIVRKAIEQFAQNAEVDVRTSRGRRS
jgi:hypothetical protein